jgi:hypothetical protein
MQLTLGGDQNYVKSSVRYAFAGREINLLLMAHLTLIISRCATCTPNSANDPALQMKTSSVKRAMSNKFSRDQVKHVEHSPKQF